AAGILEADDRRRTQLSVRAPRARERSGPLDSIAGSAALLAALGRPRLARLRRDGRGRRAPALGLRGISCAARPDRRCTAGIELQSVRLSRRLSEGVPVRTR